jgi:hypothetical protein
MENILLGGLPYQNQSSGSLKDLVGGWPLDLDRAIFSPGI